MWEQTKPAAMINDEIYYKGQMIGEMMLEDITKEYVKIKIKGNSYKFEY